MLAWTLPLGLWAEAGWTGQPSAVPPAGTARIVLSAFGDQGLAFTVSIDSLVRRSSPVRPEYSFLTFDRSVSFALPGEPDLPARRVIVGIPQRGTISVTASGEQEEVINELRVAPVLTYPGGPDDGLGGSALWKLAPSYALNAFEPVQLVTVERIAYVRDVRCAYLLVAPVQYHPGQHQCRFYRRVNVQVKFSEPASAGGTAPPPWAGIYRDLMVNGDLAGSWHTPFDSLPARNFFDRSAIWYRVKIESAGAYKISYEELVRAGANPDLIDPSTFQLFTLGNHQINAAQDSMIEAPLYVSGKADGVFAKQDYLVFYGQAGSHWDNLRTRFSRNLFTRYNYYWLTWGAEPGRRMPLGPSPPLPGSEVGREAPLRVQREEDRVCPARAGLLWVWEEFDKSDVQDSVSADFDLRLDSPVRIARLNIRVYSIDPNPDLYHGNISNHLHIFLNDRLLDSMVFGVQGPGQPLDLAYNPDSLGMVILPEKNTMRLVVVGDSQRLVFLDYFDVTYERKLSLKSGELEFILPPSAGGPAGVAIKDVARSPLVFDVTDADAPLQVTAVEYRGDSLRFTRPSRDTGVYYLVSPDHARKPLEIVRRTPGHLKRGTTPADYSIIVPDGLWDVAQLLQRYRTGNVPGIPNARVETVKLSEIYDEFGFGLEEPGAIKAFLALARPTYVLLVGDATYDYRDNLGLHPAPGVPPFEIGEDLDPNVYSNRAYAADAWYADFEGSGDSPDVIMGRLTCRSSEEFRRYFDKLVAYERGQLGFWNRRLLLLADDEIKGDWAKPDDLATTHIPANEHMADVAGTRLDPVKVYLTEYPLEEPRSKPAAQKALLDAMAEGVLIWAFFGHGAGFQLCHERALHIDDVPKVHNGRKLPFAFFGSCGVGRWEDTRNECIAEELARKDDGAIATVGATKGTSPGSNETFCAEMLTLILGRDSTLGRAFYAAWHIDRLYHLFGEPALRLQVPGSDNPAMIVPDSFWAGRPVTFSAALPINQGNYLATAYTDRRRRQYQSQYLRTNYDLPGYEFFRGLGRVERCSVYGVAMVPNQTIGARNVSNGSYTPLPGTGRLSLVGWNQDRCHSGLRDNIYFDTAGITSPDRIGPEIIMSADGKRIHDGDFLPANFQLAAQLTDSSGILLAPVPRYDLSLYFYVNNPTQRVSVTGDFLYDFGSHTTGRFTHAASLPDAEDTIYVVATDNYLNRTIAKTGVQTRIDELVRLQEPLVYPNPSNGPTSFTFRLNRSARVSVRIYTISGRLVRVLSDEDCNLGYNRISWDGTDRSGVELPNGIYIYRIDAQASETGSGANRESGHQLTDKFIVKR
jgi:hypothetical protein